MTLRRSQVQIGMEIDALLGCSPNARQVRGPVIEIVETAHECYAVVETKEHDALGPRRAYANLLRDRVQYRCKFDQQNAHLPQCPLAKLTCHSPCDIVALSYGVGFSYPDVIQLPD